MKRIDSRTVEFTTTSEVIAHDRFDVLLQDGKGIAEAAGTALDEGILAGASFSADFVEYLSENTVFVTNRGKGFVLPASPSYLGLTDAGRQAMIRNIRRGRGFAAALAHVKGSPRMVTS